MQFYPKWVNTHSQRTAALGGTPNISYKTQYSKEIFFKDIDVHENYRPPTKSDQAALNDICLIYLKQKFKLTNAISIIEFDENLKFPTSGTNCFISGWGLDQVAFGNFLETVKSHLK